MECSGNTLQYYRIDKFKYKCVRKDIAEMRCPYFFALFYDWPGKMKNNLT